MPEIRRNKTKKKIKKPHRNSKSLLSLFSFPGDAAYQSVVNRSNTRYQLHSSHSKTMRYADGWDSHSRVNAHTHLPPLTKPQLLCDDDARSRGGGEKWQVWQARDDLHHHRT